MKKLLILLLAIINIAFLPVVASDLDIKTVSTTDIKKSMDGQIPMLIIDVRDVDDYQKGHIKNALNLPVKVLNEKSLSRMIKNKKQRVIFYSENNESTKSLTASERAVLSGYEKVYRYTAGYAAWVDAGLPTGNFVKD